MVDEGRRELSRRQTLQTSDADGLAGQFMVFEDLSNRVTGEFYRAEPHSELPHCPLLQPAPLRESCSGHRDAWK